MTESAKVSWAMRRLDEALTARGFSLYADRSVFFRRDRIGVARVHCSLRMLGADFIARVNVTYQAKLVDRVFKRFGDRAFGGWTSVPPQCYRRSVTPRGSVAVSPSEFRPVMDDVIRQTLELADLVVDASQEAPAFAEFCELAVRHETPAGRRTPLDDATRYAVIVLHATVGSLGGARRMIARLRADAAVESDDDALATADYIENSILPEYETS